MTSSIQFILENKQFSKNLKELWGLSVITRNNMDLLSIVKHHKKIGFSSMQMKMARLSKDSPLSINLNHIPTLVNSIDQLLSFAVQDYVETGRMDTFLFFVNQTDYIGKYILALLSRQAYVYRCGAGLSKFCFTADGSIYPCDSFVGKKDFCLGTIYNGIASDKRELFYGLSVAERNPCHKCWARFVCGGDCFHNSYIINGDKKIPDECFCEFSKETIKLCVYYLNKLCSISPEKYQALKRLISIRSELSS